MVTVTKTILMDFDVTRYAFTINGRSNEDVIKMMRLAICGTLVAYIDMLFHSTNFEFL